MIAFRVPLPICKNERDFVGPNGMAADEVAGEEENEEVATGRSLAIRDRATLEGLNSAPHG